MVAGVAADYNGSLPQNGPESMKRRKGLLKRRKVDLGTGGFTSRGYSGYRGVTITAAPVSGGNSSIE